jgi:hypothetical protein
MFSFEAEVVEHKRVIIESIINVTLQGNGLSFIAVSG